MILWQVWLKLGFLQVYWKTSIFYTQKIILLNLKYTNETYIICTVRNFSDFQFQPIFVYSLNYIFLHFFPGLRIYIFLQIEWKKIWEEILLDASDCLGWISWSIVFMFTLNDYMNLKNSSVPLYPTFLWLLLFQNKLTASEHWYKLENLWHQKI